METHCGCTIVCQTHAAAEEMRQALQDMWNQFAYGEDETGRHSGGMSALEACEDALTHAEGRR